jgi:hypothetical protein
VLLLGLLVAVLLVQLVALRPWLDRRTRQVISGQDAPRSHRHLVYVALEGFKVAVLIALGSTLLHSL